MNFIQVYFLLPLFLTVSTLHGGIVVTEEAVSFSPRVGDVVTSHPVELVYFESLLTGYPGVYDPPNEIVCSGDTTSPLHLGIKYVIPTGGVGEETGLLVELAGIAAADCPPFANTFSFDFPPDHPSHDPVKAEWVEQRNIVLARVYYRNISYRRPYDYGKYQVVDVLRAVATMLEHFPELDRGRIYLTGGSGGGHLALQVLRVVPELFAEVYVGSAITLITTSHDVQHGGYTGDAGGNAGGWNVNMGFPVTKPAAMPEAEFVRKVAERNLRSPQLGLRRSAPLGSESPAIHVVHGDADPTVSYRHFTDLLAALEQRAESSATPVGEDRWTLENWTFLRVPGGNHSLAGGPPDRDTRSKSINAMNPDAFTARRTTAGLPVIDVMFAPEMAGWTYRFTGDFSDPSSLQLETLQFSYAGAGRFY